MSQSSSNAWDVFTIAAMMAIAAAIVGSSAPLQSSRPRPGMLDAEPGLPSEVERIPALLTRDPFDVTTLVTPQAQNTEEDKEQKRRRDAVVQGRSVVPVDALAMAVAKQLPSKSERCREHNECASVSSTIRVRVLFNLLPGDGYAESTEARRRSRYAVASALHATGYMARNSSRIGLVCMAEKSCVICDSELRTDFCSMTAAFEIFERSRHYGAVLEERCPRCTHTCALGGACCVVSATESWSTSDPEVFGCLRSEGERSCGGTSARHRDDDPARPSRECLGTPHVCERGEKCCLTKPSWKPAIADVVLVVWAREDRMLEDRPRARGFCSRPCIPACKDGISTHTESMTPDKLTHTHPYQDAVRRMKRAILQSIACESKPQCAAHDDIVQIVLVGPRSSASFQKLLTTDTDPDLVVLSPTATASFDALDKLQRWSSGSGLVPSERVLSVIANDPVLTTSIVNELARRGILSHVRCEDKQLIAGRSSSVGLMTQHRILMLGESDHPYARLLRWEYAAAFERHLSPKAQALVTEIPDHKVQQLVGNVIYHYDYFRQLDTEETAPPQPQAATSNPGLGGLSATMSSLSSAQIERPEGRSQIDYIRRIIDSAKRRLADEPHGTQIVAVGVIATDPYDKLLILQAVRKAFPNAVFFVHDVDARLLHPRELPFTRNTIIAASYGLDPDEILPGRRRRVGISAPTMRDSHQSATYVATHHAVTQCNECLLKTFPPFHEKPLGAIAAALPRDRDTETEKIQSSAESSHPTWPHARIYEIGRRGIVRLDPVNPGSGISEPVLMVCLVLAALTVGLGGELHRLWPIRPRASVSVKEGGVWRWLSRKYLYYSVLALAGFMLVLRLDDAGFASIEPLSLTNGVSVWPFIGLHVLAAAAAVRVMLIVILRTKMLSQDIEKIDGCTPPARAMTWFQESKRFVASLWLKDVHGWTHPLTKLGSPVDFWERVRNSLTVRVIFGVSLFKLGAFLAFMFAILYAYGPDPDSFRWARDSVRRYAEITWLVAYGAFVLAVLVFREVANVVIKAVSHLRWNRVICPGWSITALHAPSGPPEVSAVLTRARMIEDLATEVARLAVLLLFVLLPMIVSQSKIFERMVFSPMVMILLLIPSLLWLMPLAILQTRVRSSRGELVEELLEIKRGFLQANPPLGASDPSVASVDAAIRTVEAGGGPMAKPLMLGPFAKLLIPVVGGLALLAMHVLWGPY